MTPTEMNHDLRQAQLVLMAYWRSQPPSKKLEKRVKSAVDLMAEAANTMDHWAPVWEARTR